MLYEDFCKVYTKLDSTSKRLEKTSIIGHFLKEVPSDLLETSLLLLQGRVLAQWEEQKLGVAAKLVARAVQLATGLSLAEIEEEWKNTGDLGLAAEKAVMKKRQSTLFSSSLSLRKVFSNIQKLAKMGGAGSVSMKINLIAEILTSAKPIEARYICRTILEDLRIGIGEGVLRDAIVWAYFGEELGLTYDLESNLIVLPENKRNMYDSYVKAVQYAFNLTSDFAKVVKAAQAGGIAALQSMDVEFGKPLQLMLFQKAKDIPDAFRMVGKPAALEYKYDGFRVQAHIGKGTVMLFTRRLENVSGQFPDVVKNIKDHVSAENAILDCEIVGYNLKTNQYLPFQKISQRIKRKHDIARMAQDFPVELVVFDVIHNDGKSCLKLPFHERRKIISKIIEPEARKVVLSRLILTDDEEEALGFYNEALDAGEEGIMAKSLDAVYEPGSRVGFGVKIKPVMESLDLAIVEAEYGEGKRANWLSSFTLAVSDENGLLEIGKVSTGVKELDGEGVTYKQMTELLEPLAIATQGRRVRVKPEIIIEVHYEEIQRSTTYSSGYALRFPRFVRLRDDRAIGDIDTIETVERLYKAQRGRASTDLASGK